MSINNVDWKKIETFDQNIGWQKSLAIYVHDFSQSFARRFGEEHKDKTEPDLMIRNYNDDIVQISCRYQVYDTGGRVISTYINLVAPHRQVFSVTFIWNAQPYHIIDCFCVGSWLNHMESLRLKLEIIGKAEEEKINQDREIKFGRLD